MATFSKMSAWPIGYFRAYSSWLLRNRREIAHRVNVINAEIDRIGQVTVTYRKIEQNGNIVATEEKTGFAVTPDSSLGKLCQAYIANGGNPLDISPFIYPDNTEIIEEMPDGSIKTAQTYPNDGVIAPISVDPVDTQYGPFKGGFLNTYRYYPARQGGRVTKGETDFDTVVKTMHQIRSWANQEIKEKLQDIEWRIIKLCDLKEQLLKERDEVLVQAFGGALSGVSDMYDNDKFDPNRRVQNLIQSINQIIYDTKNDGTVRSYSPSEKVPFLVYTFPNASAEWNDTMGG